MKKRIAIVLWAANPDQPHLCGAPFFHAAAAAAMDAEVELYFTGKSVNLLVKGVAEALVTGPRQRETVYTFMRHAAEHGAKFYACSQAMEEHGVTADQFIPEANGIASATVYACRSLEEDWVTLVY